MVVVTSDKHLSCRMMYLVELCTASRHRKKRVKSGISQGEVVIPPPIRLESIFIPIGLMYMEIFCKVLQSFKWFGTMYE